MLCARGCVQRNAYTDAGMDTDAAGLEVVTSKAQLATLATEHQLDFVPRTAATLSALVRILFVPRVPWPRSALSRSLPLRTQRPHQHTRRRCVCCCCRFRRSNHLL